jgi:nitroreductase
VAKERVDVLFTRGQGIHEARAAQNEGEIMGQGDRELTEERSRGLQVGAVPGRESVFQAIVERRAVRAYTEEPVGKGEVETLLEAAINAPSAVNAQPWAFVVIQDSTLLDDYANRAKQVLITEPPLPEVLATGLPDLDGLREMAAQPGFDIFHGATTLIVVYATSATGVSDCYLAGENLMLAAWAAGLGTCPIGLAAPLFNRDDVKADLGVPSGWVAALPLVVGHPAGQTRVTTRQPPHVISWR